MIKNMYRIRAKEKALAALERLASVLYNRNIIDDERYRATLYRVDKERDELYEQYGW